MTALRETALNFLLREHGLAPAEADAALSIADRVLRTGLDRLLQAEAADDAAACLEAAHALKGSLLNLGLASLADVAHRIQTAAPAVRHTLIPQLAAGIQPFFK